MFTGVYTGVSVIESSDVRRSQQISLSSRLLSECGQLVKLPVAPIVHLYEKSKAFCMKAFVE